MKLYFKLETKHSFYRDPNPETNNTREFNAIWKVIIDWDIGMTYKKYSSFTGVCKLSHPQPIDPRKLHIAGSKILYSGATGNNVRQILDSLNPQKKL